MKTTTLLLVLLCAADARRRRRLLGGPDVDRFDWEGFNVRVKNDG